MSSDSDPPSGNSVISRDKPEPVVEKTSQVIDEKLESSKLLDYVETNWLNNQQFVDSTQESVKKKEIVVKMTEMLQLVKDLSTKDGSPEDKKDISVAQLDWGAVYELSSKILGEYSRKIDSIFNELETINKNLGYWQEAGFTFDAHRGIKVMNNSEEWMKEKAHFLTHRQQQLDATVKEISNTVNKLSKTE